MSDWDDGRMDELWERYIGLEDHVHRVLAGRVDAHIGAYVSARLTPPHLLWRGGGRRRRGRRGRRRGKRRGGGRKKIMKRRRG